MLGFTDVRLIAICSSNNFCANSRFNNKVFWVSKRPLFIVGKIVQRFGTCTCSDMFVLSSWPFLRKMFWESTHEIWDESVAVPQITRFRHFIDLFLPSFFLAHCTNAQVFFLSLFSPCSQLVKCRSNGAFFAPRLVPQRYHFFPLSRWPNMPIWAGKSWPYLEAELKSCGEEKKWICSQPRYFFQLYFPLLFRHLFDHRIVEEMIICGMNE